MEAFFTILFLYTVRSSHFTADKKKRGKKYKFIFFYYYARILFQHGTHGSNFYGTCIIFIEIESGEMCLFFDVPKDISNKIISFSFSGRRYIKKFSGFDSW